MPGSPEVLALFGHGAVAGGGQGGGVAVVAAGGVGHLAAEFIAVVALGHVGLVQGSRRAADGDPGPGAVPGLGAEG